MLFLFIIDNLFQFPLSPFPSYCRRWRYTRRLRFTIQQYRLLTHLLHYIISQLLQCHFSLNLLQFFQQIEWDIWDKKNTHRNAQKGIRCIFLDIKKAYKIESQLLVGSFLRYGRDSNPRPPAWQAGILTSWTTTPLSLSWLIKYLSQLRCKDSTFFCNNQTFYELFSQNM